MAEYIERETAVAWFMPYEHAGESIDADVVISDIKGMKAADVAPVRHGRWEDKPNPQWRAYDIRYCSACGWSIHKSKLRNADLNWAYCPSCGARMDGGAD